MKINLHLRKKVFNLKLKFGNVANLATEKFATFHLFGGYVMNSVVEEIEKKYKCHKWGYTEFYKDSIINKLSGMDWLDIFLN